MDTNDIPLSGLKEFVSSLAAQNAVSHVLTGRQALARVITHLSDDVVEPDETECLIIALRRAGVIDDQQMVIILGRYLDEIHSSS